MREIKFRSWNSFRKIMDLEPSTSCGGWEDFPINEISKDPDVILMQYTGLKDKNGNEIYEGDIVRFLGAEFEHRSQDEVWVEEEKETKQVIEFEDGCFQPFGWISMWHDPNYVTWEIIGNIYENFELLKSL